MRKQITSIYPPADSMNIEGTKPECVLHIIKAPGYSQMEICHRLILFDPNRAIHFRLDSISMKQLLALISM